MSYQTLCAKCKQEKDNFLFAPGQLLKKASTCRKCVKAYHQKYAMVTPENTRHQWKSSFRRDQVFGVSPLAAIKAYGWTK